MWEASKHHIDKLLGIGSFCNKNEGSFAKESIRCIRLKVVENV